MELRNELLRQSEKQGRVDWIGVARESRGPVTAVASVQAEAGCGLVGEHHHRPKNRSKRQVTLIQAEHLSVVAALMECEEVSPGLLRRNIVVSGINLAALRGLRFRIGDAELIGTGGCPPCSRMEENLGQGGYAAMLGHGGLTAVVAESGTIRVGDVVTAIGPAEAGAEQAGKANSTGATKGV